MKVLHTIVLFFMHVLTSSLCYWSESCWSCLFCSHCTFSCLCGQSGFWCWLCFHCRFSCLCGWRLCHHLQLTTNLFNPSCIDAVISKFGVRILHQPQMQGKVSLRNTHKVASTYQLCRLRVALAEAFSTGLQAFSFIIAVRTADSSTTGESQNSHRYSS